MKIYNSYIITITTLLLLTTVILAALGQRHLESFYTAYIIEAIVVTEIYVHFSSRARRGLNMANSLLFIGFLFILSLQIIKILVS